MAAKSYLDLTKEELDAMTPQQRAWAALDYTYGRQVEKSNEDFAKAYSQAANAQISRGMQRSSYGAQTLANLQKQGVEAANDIRSQQSAAYANQLYQIERDEKADDQWQKQFEYQKERDTVGDTQWQKQFEYQQGRDTVADKQWQDQFAYQKDRDTVGDTQWQKQFDESVRQFNVLHPEDTGGGGGGGGSYSGGGGGGNTTNNTNTINDEILKGMLDTAKSTAKSSVTINPVATTNPVTVNQIKTGVNNTALANANAALANIGATRVVNNTNKNTNRAKARGLSAQ